MDAGPNAGEASWKLLAEPGVTLGLLDCGNVRLSWRREKSQEIAGLVGHSGCLGQRLFSIQFYPP